jgi:hypothetical protein
MLLLNGLSHYGMKELVVEYRDVPDTDTCIWIKVDFHSGK